MADRPRFTTQGRTEPRKYFTAVDEDVPSPPPSRPRSRSLPISGASGALARIARRKEAEATAQGDIVIDTSASAAVPATQRAIDRVPTEIISALLTAWMAEESSTPYGLGNRVPFYAMQICSFWRRAAKATLYLWQHPNFCFRQMLKHTDVWIAYHACFVRYGGTQGFHVTLENSVSAVLETNAAWAHFRERILVKARSIDLEVANSMADDDILARHRYPFLRELRVRSREAIYPDIRLSMKAPQLRHVELDGVDMTFDDWANRATNALSALTSLNISHRESTVESLLYLSRMCPVVTDFSLAVDKLRGVRRCASFTWPSVVTLRVSARAIRHAEDIRSRSLFPNATTLEAVRLRIELDLRSREAIYPDIRLSMKAPQLRHVELDGVDMTFDDWANRATNALSALTSLNISHRESTVESLLYLSRMCPVVTDFSLAVDKLRGVRRCASFTWPSVVTLRVSARAIRHAEDIRSRSLFPNATTLELSDFASNWPFWRSFVETSCPAVTTLCVRRNHVDHTMQFLTGMGTLSQLRTLVFRDGSLNADIVNGLVRPVHGLPMPFVGLRTVRFENAVPHENMVPRRDSQYECIRAALLLRYSYLLRDHRPTRFVLLCALKPRFEDPAYDVYRERIARMVLRWNEEEFERAQGIWKYM
ncbi:hypothetical protein AURDEDRAFT_164230 [Auricularia subglabra TFB-10046 SS5]|nr:hypothetical protein AURDEDRAFT_164230 [Auricularia subglabra TFB-10046 SS5]